MAPHQPFGFKHDLDLDLFALDRLDHLARRAPDGAFKVQLGDEGHERSNGVGPTYTTLEGSLADDLARRRLHVHFHDLPDWAGAEYGAARDQILDQLGLDPGDRLAESVVVRAFSPDVPVALHADGEIAIDCGVGGTNVWHFYDRTVLSHEEHEALHRGGQFLRWREADEVRFELAPGDGCVVPSRWPHYLEHPGPEPAVSFDLGYWTRAAMRERKVYDVNWLLRKAHLHPTPPGVIPGRDAFKRRFFDAATLVMRKGDEFRGV